MQITVNTTQGLTSALASAQSGDTILLASGSYSTIGLQNVNFSGSGVTIASADAGNPAQVAGVELARCSGLTFRDLDVSINTRLQTAFNVADSSNIKLDGLNMHDVPGGGLGGLFVRNSNNVTVTDTDFHDLGTAARSMGSNFVTISDSRFTEIRGDGIQSTASSNVTLDGNHFTNFHTAPGDHPDAIQFFTYNQTAPAQNIVITDNVFVRGSGDVVQGIFLGNESGQPYVNVTISGNKIVGGMYNGIVVGMGQNVTVTDNVVQAYADQDSWISVQQSSGVTISNNQTTALITGNTNTNITQSGNTTLTAVAVGDSSILGVSHPVTPPAAVVVPPPAAVVPNPVTPVAPVVVAPVTSSTGSSSSGSHTQGANTDTAGVPDSILQKVAGGAPQAVAGLSIKGANLQGSEAGDTLSGTGGSHEIYGGAGNDSISGGEGQGILRGEDGNDSIVGGSAFDDINGNVGDDVLAGGAGNDWVLGGQGDDKISGDEGDDLVYGNLGNDSASGGMGNDTVRGGQGNDTISGGAGDDWLSGDRGDDVIYGGAGADTFHFFAEAGKDVVKDFNAAEGDRVMLDPGSIYDVTQVGADTVISIHGGGQMILEGVTMSTLKAGWVFGA